MLVSAQELRIWMWSFAQHLLLYNDLPSVLLLPGPLHRSVLPCLPPASTLQIDVNGDAEWPARRSCVQEHACSFLTHPTVLRLYLLLTSTSLSESQMSFGQPTVDQAPVQQGDWPGGRDCSLFTGEHPVLFAKAQRWVHEHSPASCAFL